VGTRLHVVALEVPTVPHRGVDHRAGQVVRVEVHHPVCAELGLRCCDRAARVLLEQREARVGAPVERGAAPRRSPSVAETSCVASAAPARKLRSRNGPRRGRGTDAMRLSRASTIACVACQTTRVRVVEDGSASCAQRPGFRPAIEQCGTRQGSCCRERVSGAEGEARSCARSRWASASQYASTWRAYSPSVQCSAPAAQCCPKLATTTSQSEKSSTASTHLPCAGARARQACRCKARGPAGALCATSTHPSMLCSRQSVAPQQSARNPGGE